jgi:uncharacterized protein
MLHLESKCWTLMAKRHSLSIDEARALYGEVVDSTHDFDHVMRVYRLAERIGQAEGADMPVLRTACLLHDIGRADQETGRVPDHAAEGARRARDLLSARPPQFVDAVAHAIAAHRFRGDDVQPRTLEARILYDADKLDAIGAVGIARAFCYGAHQGQPLWGPPDADTHTPVKEFAVKLSRIKDVLFTESARAIAEERHQFMVRFYQRMAAEISGQA